ncbi:ABC transporter ATP-binding protein [Roseibium sp. SCP14]|uniref:ABC transporter ATP-binding protein n=1 Tax=Roseibium sp. SCP14 TaxID=3141375 RepID=UPI00333BEA63
MQTENILEIEDLKISFNLRDGTVNAVNGVSFSVRPGEVLGVVGESGSGKSLTARAIMNLLPRAADVTGGRVRFRKGDGTVLDILKEKRESATMRALRGGSIGMIFQEPMTALSPVHSIGKQIMTTLNLHTDLSKKAQVDRAAELLDLVQMPKPMEMLKKYPHQLSGGMRQRAMIAMALSCNPSLLLADEPTTALDVTTEAQILDLIMSLQDKMNMAVLFITHNFGVVAEIADRVTVMYLGNDVETASVDDIFYAPKHPYTRALLKSIPRLDGQKKHRLQTIEGMVPDPFNLPSGCVFHTRCTEALSGRCEISAPEPTHFDNAQMARCHLHQDQPGPVA